MEEAKKRIKEWIDAGKNFNVLNLSNLNLKGLPELPEDLRNLHCQHNNLTNLPVLPSNLEYLYCNDNQLTSLPEIPNSVIELVCYNNQLTTIPTLPTRLEYYDFSNNPLKEPFKHIVHDDKAGLLYPDQFIEMINEANEKGINNNNNANKNNKNNTKTNNTNNKNDYNVNINSPEMKEAKKKVKDWIDAGKVNNVLDLSKLKLTNLPALPDNLQMINCAYNNLTSLPELPDNLILLICNNNQLTNLPALPNSLSVLYCNNNNLTGLPELSNSLRELSCGYNQLTSLPTLPETLNNLSCAKNKLTILPILPSNLKYIHLTNNPLSEPFKSLWEQYNNKTITIQQFIEEVNKVYEPQENSPGMIEAKKRVKEWIDAGKVNNMLDLYGLGLTVLPQLPDNLKGLNCSTNQLTSLPQLPNSLTFLFCVKNKLTSLPELPDSLTEIYSSNNNITTIPKLPKGLKAIGLSNNPLIEPFKTFWQKKDVNMITIKQFIEEVNNVYEPQANVNTKSAGIKEAKKRIKEWVDAGNVKEYLELKNLNLSVLPKLPDNLKILNCAYNNLTSLTGLPNGLIILYCENNKLTSLTGLPDSLIQGTFNNNNITTIPKLPKSLKHITLNNNKLIEPFKTLWHNTETFIIKNQDFIDEVNKLYQTSTQSIQPPRPLIQPTQPNIPQYLYAERKNIPNLTNMSYNKNISHTTGTGLYKNTTNTKWVAKTGTMGQGSYAQVVSEAVANSIYKALGVPVPDFKLDTKNKALILSYVDGKLLEHATPVELDKASKELSKHFIVDALLENWDVLGYTRDNIILPADGGPPIRIDNGGSLEFSGTGPKKPFTNNVVEIETMRNPSISPQCAVIFGKLTDEDINQQIKDIIIPNKDLIISLTPSHLQKTMENRIKYLIHRLNTKKGEAILNTITNVNNNIKTNQLNVASAKNKVSHIRDLVKADLSDLEYQSVVYYTEDGSSLINMFLYSKLSQTPDLHEQVIQMIIKNNPKAPTNTNEAYNNRIMFILYSTLMSAVTKGPKIQPSVPFKVYRRIQNDYLVQDSSKFYYMNSFVSTTSEKLVSNSTSYVFYIHPACVYASLKSISRYPENEILFTPYHRYLYIKTDGKQKIFVVLPSDLTIPTTSDTFSSWKDTVFTMSAPLKGGRVKEALLTNSLIPLSMKRQNKTLKRVVKPVQRVNKKPNMNVRMNTTRNRNRGSNRSSRFTDPIPSFPGKAPTAREWDVINTMIKMIESG